MHTLLEIGWEYIINILETTLFYYFVRVLLTPRKIPHQNIIHFLALLGRFLTITACNFLPVSIELTLLICTTYNILFACFLFKEKKSVCAFWGALCCLIGILSETIVMSSTQVVAGIFYKDMYIGGSFRFPITTMYIIVLGAFSFFIPAIATKKKLLFRGFQKAFVAISIILGILIMYGFTYLITSVEQKLPELVDVLILTNLVFLCFFISLLIYVYQLALTQYENEELQAKAHLLELEQAQYDNLLNTTDSLRVIKHDIQHHLTALRGYLEHDSAKQALSYLGEYEEEFDRDYNLISTGNIVVDSILATKCLDAKRQNTQFGYKIHLPKKMPISDVALSSLLGNLLDNALEGCRRIDETDRKILFIMKLQETMLSIVISNTYDGIVEESAPQRFRSRKTEAGHGVGLARVQTLVEEANGFTEITHDKQQFTVQIILPLETTDED